MTSGVSFTATGSSSQLPVVSYQFLIREQMLISIREQTTENFLEETMVKSITTPRKLPRDLALGDLSGVANLL
jgi:hypothetical protein